jgi:hypothetical protein
MSADYFVAVDAGNGFTNAVSSKLKGKLTKVSFPSVRADAPNRTLNLGVGLEVQYEVVEWLGNYYTYGADTVRLSAGSLERHHGRDRYGDEFQGMLVAIAMAKMKIPSKKKINLTLFMPPGLINEEYKKHVVDSFKHGLSIVINGKEHEWEFNKINVFPEGLGAMVSFAISHTLKQLKNGVFDGDIVIIDAGTYTLDILLVRDGNFDPASLETATWGSDGLFHHIISPLIQVVHKHDDDFKVVTPDMIDKAIYESHYGRGCTVKSANKVIHLDDALERVSLRYANWLTKNILDTHYRSLLGVKSVILVGGGAHLLRQHLEKDLQFGQKILDYGELSCVKNVRPTELNAVGGQRMARFQEMQNGGE